MITSRPCLAVWSLICGILLAGAGGVFAESWWIMGLTVGAISLAAIAIGLRARLPTGVLSGVAVLLASLAGLMAHEQAWAMTLPLVPALGAFYVHWYANAEDQPLTSGL